jgi:hypothetical protein
MSIEIPGLSDGNAMYCVPGVLRQGNDPTFVEGFSWGRNSYFNEVYSPVWPDGSPVEGIRPGQDLSQVQAVKDHELSVEDLVQEIALAARELAQGDVTPVLNAGYLFGFFAACVEDFYGVACVVCGAASGCCEHRPL